MPPDMGDMSLDLESDEGMGEPADDEAMAADMGELDPQFAADVSEAFPDLDDAQLTALQRAVMGLIGR